jgi:hypothetical protein
MAQPPPLPNKTMMIIIILILVMEQGGRRDIDLEWKYNTYEIRKQEWGLRHYYLLLPSCRTVLVKTQASDPQKKINIVFT